MVSLYNLKKLSFKYEDWSFCSGHISKKYWHFSILNFLCIFHIFKISASKFYPTVEIIWNLLEVKETIYYISKCPDISENRALILVCTLIFLRKCDSIIQCESPCTTDIHCFPVSSRVSSKVSNHLTKYIPPCNRLSQFSSMKILTNSWTTPW